MALQFLGEALDRPAVDDEIERDRGKSITFVTLVLLEVDFADAVEMEADVSSDAVGRGWLPA